jgi:hypothetical protein
MRVLTKMGADSARFYGVSYGIICPPVCPKIATGRFKLRHLNETPAAVFMGKSNNPWFLNRFFILFSALDGGPSGRIFYFGFGTKAANHEVRSLQAISGQSRNHCNPPVASFTPH